MAVNETYIMRYFNKWNYESLSYQKLLKNTNRLYYWRIIKWFHLKIPFYRNYFSIIILRHHIARLRPLRFSFVVTKQTSGFRTDYPAGWCKAIKFDHKSLVYSQGWRLYATHIVSIDELLEFKAWHLATASRESLVCGGPVN